MPGCGRTLHVLRKGPAPCRGAHAQHYGLMLGCALGLGGPCQLHSRLSWNLCSRPCYGGPCPAVPGAQQTCLDARPASELSSLLWSSRALWLAMLTHVWRHGTAPVACNGGRGHSPPPVVHDVRHVMVAHALCWPSFHAPCHAPPPCVLRVGSKVGASVQSSSPPKSPAASAAVVPMAITVAVDIETWALSMACQGDDVPCFSIGGNMDP